MIQTIYNGGDVASDGPFVQVSRLGMPLTNEAVIPIGMKDRWNATSPYGGADLQFAKYFTNPELALYMDDSKFGGAVPSLNAYGFRKSHWARRLPQWHARLVWLER
jgi:hypothetical protein